MKNSTIRTKWRHNTERDERRAKLEHTNATHFENEHAATTTVILSNTTGRDFSFKSPPPDDSHKLTKGREI